MKFIGRLFLFAVTSLALIQACSAGPSTAQLTINGATCSGTIVAPSAILSAAHCFKGEDEEDDDDPIAKFLGHVSPPPTFMTVDGYKVFIEAITYDDADHALVKVIFTFKEYSQLSHERPAVGGKVHYWGNAAGRTNTYREGYVTSYVKGEMVMDVNGFFGDSGAGIFDESGKVAGVVSYLTTNRREGMTFKLMGAYPLEFTPLQYSMMGVSPP
jgi:V8-like Glu-specific endopeptidase